MYGVVNNALQNDKSIDVTLYDLAQCFDSQWYEETMNDLWDIDIDYDKFAVVAKMINKSETHYMGEGKLFIAMRNYFLQILQVKSRTSQVRKKSILVKS